MILISSDDLAKMDRVKIVPPTTRSNTPWAEPVMVAVVLSPVLGAAVGGTLAGLAGAAWGVLSSLLLLGFLFWQVFLVERQVAVPVPVSDQFERLADTLDCLHVFDTDRMRANRRLGRSADGHLDGVPITLELGDDGYVDRDLMVGGGFDIASTDLDDNPAIPTAGFALGLKSGKFHLQYGWRLDFRLGYALDRQAAKRMYRVSKKELARENWWQPFTRSQLASADEVESGRGRFKYVTTNLPLVRYRPSMERAGVWKRLERLSAAQSPFALTASLDNGEVVLHVPMTDRLDSMAIEQLGDALSDWRKGLLAHTSWPPPEFARRKVG